jgi:hypothetical protein
VDKVGNTESDKTLIIKIDKTSPVVTAVLSRSPDHGTWYNDPVGTHYSATDATSGVASCDSDKTYSSPDSATASGPLGTCTDNAGNSASARVSSFPYDATDPVVTAALVRSPDSNNWYNQPVNTHYSATDATSGVASCDDDKTYSGPDSATASGPLGTCTDNAGNSVDKQAPVFKYDDNKPTTTATVARDPDSGSLYTSPVDVSLSCVDGANGSGCNQTTYSLDGVGGTYSGVPINVDTSGVHTILYRSNDFANNVETDKTLTIEIQAATISITTTPHSERWGDEITIQGGTQNTVSTNKVSVNWDDGLKDEVVIGTGGAWSAKHTYGPILSGPRIVVAEVVDSNHVGVSSTASVQITITKRPAVISLEDVADPTHGDIYVRGNLRDGFTNKGVLPGRAITFANNPDIILGSSTTGEIKVTNNPLITLGTCGSSSDKSIIVNEGAQIIVPGKPTSVNIGKCDTSIPFDYLVTDGAIPPFTSTQSSLVNPQSGDGITIITISNTGGGTVELTSLEGSNAGGQSLFSTGFDITSANLSSDGKTLSLNDGIFATSGIAPGEDGLVGSIIASLSVDDYYQPSNIATKSYTVEYSPGGIGANVNVVTDIGDLVSYDTGTDSDRDGILDSWESDGADADTELDGIPYTCSTGTCYLKLQNLISGPPAVGTDDVYLEVDGFALHVNAASVADLANKFAESHPGAAQPTRLHYIISDTSVPEAATVSLWRDIEGTTGSVVQPNNRGNDYDSLKADWFGQPADRATLNTGSQSNNYVDGDSVSFSGLSLTTPGGGLYSSDNKVYGTIILKMKINFNAAPTSIAQSSSACTGVGAGVTIGNIASTFSNGATSSQKIMITKIKFSTTGAVTNAAVGTCQVNLTIGSTTIKSSGGTEKENVSPVIFTEKQLAKLKVFRYMFMAHSLGGPSGRAEIWGNDAVTALSAYTQVNGHGVGSQDEQAGTIMHELGHMLNLDHGGARWLQPTDVVNPQVLGQSGINCKPNYISVMPYHRQLPGTYLNQASVGGSGGWQLGYSSGKLGNLNELNLDERNGLVSSDPVGSAIPRLVWATPGVSPNYKGGANLITLGGTGIPPVLANPASATDINWDGDSDAVDVYSNVRKDINNYGIYGCQASNDTTLSDGNDWANLDFRLGLNPTGTFGDGDSVYELNTQQLQQIELASANFIIIPPPAIDGQEIRKSGSQLPIKIDLQRQDGTDITYARLYAEYYTTNPAQKTAIGSATYDSVVGHYAIPWKTPRNPPGVSTIVYNINVYVDNPIPTETDRHLVSSPPLKDNLNNPITIKVTLN